METERLRYRRQFMLTADEIPSLSNWRNLRLREGVHAYWHPDLESTSWTDGERWILMLGYAFDADDPGKLNDEVVADIAARSTCFQELLRAIAKYSGRYAIVYQDAGGLQVVHDPLAVREVYYCTRPNRVICGSQPNLLHAYSEPRIEETTDNGIRTFYHNEMKHVRFGRLWVGDETYYDGVRHLLPNHYFEGVTRSAKRYWPQQRLETKPLDEAVRFCCSFLQGVMRAVTIRYSVMMAVTSGHDSRTLLAASRDVSSRIYYFINKEQHLDDAHPDLVIPQAIFRRIGLPFHVHRVQGVVDDAFRRAFLENTFLSTDRILSTIYNVYYRQHCDRMNILGVGEIGRKFYGDEPRHIDGYFLARCLKFRDSKYVVDQCDRWLQESRPIAQRCNVNILTLFLWEQLLGNWGAVGNSESDIAIEEFDPYNSHLLYETMLSVPQDDVQHDDSILFKEMLRHMWPELLEFPINPPHTTKDRVDAFLEKTGIYAPLKRFLYSRDRRRYLRRQQPGN
jgi:hypothetical protein